MIAREECPVCGEHDCQCDDDYGDELDCTHCAGDGICDEDCDIFLYGGGDTIHNCHACGGTGRRADQRIF